MFFGFFKKFIEIVYNSGINIPGKRGEGKFGY